MADGPTIQISRELKPQLAEFSFDTELYREALLQSDMPEASVDALTVRFSNRDHSATLQTKLSLSLLGNVLTPGGQYESDEHRITLFPHIFRGMGSSEGFSDQWLQPNEDRLNSMLNFVLAHESSHAINREIFRASVMPSDEEIRHTARNIYQRMLVGGAVGTAAFTGLALATGGRVGVGAATGLGLGTISGALTGSLSPEVVEQRESATEIEHDRVDAFLATPTTQALFRSIVHLKFA